MAPTAKPSAPAGTATTAKMTLVGRPASIKSHLGFIEFQLENNQAPNLPRGLPLWVRPSIRSYVNDRQWSKVSEAASKSVGHIDYRGLSDGCRSNGASEAKTLGVILFATNVVSKLAQQHKKSMLGE